MPVVPRVSQPTVEQQLVSQPKARNQDISSGAQAFGQAIGQGAQTGLDVMKQLDTTAAEEAMVNFERAKNDIFFNPESGYFNSQGKSAVEGAQPTQKMLQDLYRQHSGNLKSTQARQMFERAAQVRIARDEHTILQHATKGRKVYESATLQALQENALENGALYWNNDDELTVARVSGRQAVIDQAEVEGLDGQVLAERLQTFESVFAKTAISAAIDTKDIARAGKLLERYNNSLEGPDKLVVQKALAAETDKQDILSKVDSIYRPGRPLHEMLPEARMEQDPDKRKEIERLVSNMYTADEKAREERISRTYNDTALQLEQGRLTYTDIKQQQLEELSPSQRANLKKIEDDRVSGKGSSTDWAVYNSLMMLPDEELKKIDPADYFTHLAQGERQKLITAVRSAKDGTVDKDKTFGRTQATALSQTVDQLFGKKAKPEQVNAFNRLVREQAEFEGVKTMVQFEELLGRMTTKVVKERAFWFDSEVTLKDIPTDYQTDLAAELRRAGKPVTPAAMYELYTLAKKKGLIK